MSRCYIDSSAAIKLVARESESLPLREYLDTESLDLVSTWLLATEMRRAAQRSGGLIDQQTISDLLEGIDLYEIPAAVFRAAGVLPGAHLRSLDALHLAAASTIGVDAVLTYDTRMAGSARDLGLRVLAPA